jgi:hypothetical protein
MASYYTGWWDKPIPVLGNRTPRQAQKSTSGKREVDLLLREMEWHEARKPAWQRVDIAELRGRG